MLAWSSGVRWGSSPVPHPCIRHSWDTTRSRHYQSTFKGSRSSRLYLHIACAAVDTQPIRTGCEISSLTNRGRLKRLFWWTKYNHAPRPISQWIQVFYNVGSFVYAHLNFRQLFTIRIFWNTTSTIINELINLINSEYIVFSIAYPLTSNGRSFSRLKITLTDQRTTMTADWVCYLVRNRRRCLFFPLL